MCCYDNLLKPDLVATDNKLVAAAADQNYLLRNYPNLNANVAKDAHHNQVALSGTSMAAPVVAGLLNVAGAVQMAITHLRCL